MRDLGATVLLYICRRNDLVRVTTVVTRVFPTFPNSFLLLCIRIVQSKECSAPVHCVVCGSRRCDGNRSRDKSTSRSVRRLATPLAAAQTVDSHARSRAGMITPNIDYIVHEYSLMLHMSLRRPEPMLCPVLLSFLVSSASCEVR